MATKSRKAAAKPAAPVKKAVRPAAARAQAPAPHSEAYEAALREYAQALDLMRRGSFAEARDKFAAIEAANGNEPELADRARTYGTLCARRARTDPAEPGSTEERYLLGVVRSNEGRLDEAAALLDRVLRDEPGSARALYARASVRALQGRVDLAIADLRPALSAEPTLRFQAANDPDFEKIRNEAAFIDLIEPTPAGA